MYIYRNFATITRNSPLVGNSVRGKEQLKCWLLKTFFFKKPTIGEAYTQHM